MAYTPVPLKNAVIPGGFGNYPIAERNLMTGDMRAISGRPVVPGQELPPLQMLGEEVAPAAAPTAVAKKAGLNRKRAKYAEALGGKLLEEGISSRPTEGYGWSPFVQGLTRMASGGLGGYMVGNAQRREEAADAEAMERFQQLARSGKATSADYATLAADPNTPDAMRSVAGAYLEAELKGGDDTWRPMTQTEKEAYGIKPGTPAQINAKGQVKSINEGGVSINMPAEGERQAAAMVEGMKADYGVFDANFAALSDPQGAWGRQFAAKIPLVGDTLANYLAAPEYQMARDAVQNIMRGYNKIVSGAAVSEQEFQRSVDLAIPRPGDSPQTVALKKARIEGYVRAVEQAAGRTGAKVERPADTSFEDPADIPEGATVEDEQGQRWKKVNGALQPVE